MKTFVIISAIAILISGCGKTGIGGSFSQLAGNWAQIKEPDGCKVKQIAAESSSGVAVLCEDGRIFH